MNISSRLITIAQNQEKVYHAGQLSVVKDNENLKGSASGTAISITDVSPIEHDVQVKLTSDTVTDFSKVKLFKYGRNLFDYTLPYITSKALDKNTGELIVWGGSWCVYDYIEIQPNITCTVNPELNQGRYPICFYDENKVFISSSESSGVNNVTVFTTPPNCKYMRISAVIADAPTSMIVLGEYTNEQMALMEYEPYKGVAEYSINADGTIEGVTSIYPIMSLITDTSGVTITANYIKDINKTFNALKTNVALSGGN